MNKTQRSLPELKNHYLRDHIKSLKEPNMTSYEQVLVRVVLTTQNLEKQLNDIIKVIPEDKSVFHTQSYQLIQFCLGAINNFCDDFNKLFHFIMAGLAEKLVNKDYVKFGKFFYSRYGGMLKEINRIRDDTKKIVNACVKRFV